MNCRHCDAKITVYDSGIGKIDECRDCASDVEKYVGHMVWDHKTAPALEVHANSKSLAALRDGRQRAGGNLIYEVKDRARRRESDISACDSMSLTPYVRKEMPVFKEVLEDLPNVLLRRGNGKTVATFSKSLLEKGLTQNVTVLSHLQGEKLLLAKAVSRMKLSQIAGFSITVWKDEKGFYVIPKREVDRSRLDGETLRRLDFRTSNF